MTDTRTDALLNPENLKKALYYRVTGKAAIGSLSGTGIVCCFIKVTMVQAFILGAVIVSVFLAVLYGLGRLTNSQISRQFYTADESLDRLIQQHLHLPLQKAVETLLLCSLAAIICSAVMAFGFGLTGHELYIPFSAWLIMSVISAASAYLECTRVTTSALDELIVLHGEDMRKKIVTYSKRKFLGVPLNTHYFFQVLIPVTLTFILMLLLICEDQLIQDFNLPVRFACLSCMSVLMVTVDTITFFRYVKNTGHKIETVVEQVLRGEEYSQVETDSSSEIAYTAHLVNVIHLNTAEDRKRMAQKMQQLMAKQQSMNNLYPKIEKILEEGIKAIDRERELLEKVADENNAITVRITEARTVARKTGETVGESQKALQQNIQKMQEIAAANKTTTAGILSLSNKISGIWEIVDLIDSIADQTTIIAFNAELEAEKIHQNRDKFKNVAYAIRNLTDQVLELTGKIRSDIRKIQEASTVLLEQGRESTRFIEDGAKIASNLSSTLRLMGTSAGDSADLSDSVRTISEDFTSRMLSLQKQLEKCREYLTNYYETIHIELELARKAGSFLEAEE